MQPGTKVRKSGSTVGSVTEKATVQTQPTPLAIFMLQGTNTGRKITVATPFELIIWFDAIKADSTTRDEQVFCAH